MRIPLRRSGPGLPSSSLILCFLSLLFASPVHAGSLWLVVDPPPSPPQSGATFETKLQFSSWDVTIGSYLIAIRYDPAVIRILNVTVSAESVFSGNTFADTASFSSGETDIAGFQVLNQNQQDTLATFATVQWEVVGPPGSSSNIQFEIKTLVDPLWKPFDAVQLIGTTIEILDPSVDTDNDGMPDAWEKAHNLNWLVDDALEDADNDGYSNLREYLSGTDPQDDEDIPSILADFENDFDVDGLDLSHFVEEFGRTDCDTAPEPCNFDFDTDGDVDEIDLKLFSEDFGRAEQP